MRVSGISLPPVINDPKNFSHPIAKTDKKAPNFKKEDSYTLLVSGIAG